MKLNVKHRMGRRRSISSSRVLLAVLADDPKFCGGFTTKDLIERLHLDASAIRCLERKQLLLRERGRITEDSLAFLCKEHPDEIPFETLDEDTKQMLLGDYGYGSRKLAQL